MSLKKNRYNFAKKQYPRKLSRKNPLEGMSKFKENLNKLKQITNKIIQFEK